MEAIAPVLSLPFYSRARRRCPRRWTRWRRSRGRSAIPPRAAGRGHGPDAHLDRLAARVARHADRPLALVDIGDARHLRAFGFDSLFGSTLNPHRLAQRLVRGDGLQLPGPGSLERLADMPDARLVIAGPIPPQAQGALSRSRLWQALPQVAQGRVHHLPRMNALAGYPPRCVFGDLLARELEA